MNDFCHYNCCVFMSLSQITYIETSAKDPPMNVDKAFHELVRVIRCVEVYRFHLLWPSVRYKASYALAFPFISMALMLISVHSQQIPERGLKKKRKAKWRADRPSGSQRLHCVLLWPHTLYLWASMPRWWLQDSDC